MALLFLGIGFVGLSAEVCAENLRPVSTPFSKTATKRRYDTKMIIAAEIAMVRARPRTTARCWRYVKDALLAADVIDTRPETILAKQAGEELCRKYGFTKLNITNPFEAPVGAVIVYGGRNAGHVELRTATGFVSDFVSDKPSSRPPIGIYVKLI